MTDRRLIAILVFFLFSIQTLECRIKCCCCDKTAPITKEDKKIRDLVLQHLQLEGNKLDDIVTEVNNCADNIAKIKKIIDYTSNIDWSNPKCPNTLIKWENQFCIYISYFHLRLNNPYFLKFFLICDRIDSLHRKDTHVLNAMCETVRWCVERPSFNKKNMGSIDKIMKAFFLKDKDSKYFYFKKEESLSDEGSFPLLKDYYYGNITPGTGTYSTESHNPHRYGSLQNDNIIACVTKCILWDLGINDEQLRENIMSLIYYTQTQPFTEANIDYISQKNQKDNKNSKDQDSNDTKKLLGLSLSQHDHHAFAIVNYNGEWYNKNSVLLDNCGCKTIDEIKQLYDTTKNIKTTPTESQINLQESYFVFFEILKT